MIGTVPGVLIGGIPQGQAIGTVVGGTTVDVNVAPFIMKNSKNRFRNPYVNQYRGWMFVVDGSVNIYKKDLKASLMVAASSGDENPNLHTVDKVYRGFIPLQSIYSGKRVRSVFLLGGAGRLPRPLSVPDSEQAPSPFANVVNGFTNLVLCGGSLLWVPSDWTNKFKLNPNVLAYWQERPTHKFDARMQKVSHELASRFLGVELDCFMDYFPLEVLRLYCVCSVFFPGQHYKDIQGLPLSKEEKMALDLLDATGFEDDRIPNIGHNIAYTFNLGMEFTF
jgi:hypothetical protein